MPDSLKSLDVASIHLLLGAEEKGPFTEGEVRQKFRSGECSSETLAWKEGMSDWSPISTFTGLSAPPPVRPAPPPPPVAIASPAVASVPGLKGFTGHLLIAFVLPLLAFVLWSLGAGFFGLILVVFAGYDSWRAFRLALRRRHRKVIAMGCVGFSVLSCVVTLLISGAPSMPQHRPGDQAPYGPSIGAWNVLVSAMEAARNASPDVSISSTLAAELSAINAIDVRGVDNDLSSLISRHRELLQRELQITSLVESEARAVNDNAQVSSAMLEVIFGAAGAQNDIDPWRGASRGQQAGAEMANGLRLNQLGGILRQHGSEIIALKNEEASLGAELIQLEQKLRVRYPGFFSPG